MQPSWWWCVVALCGLCSRADEERRGRRKRVTKTEKIENSEQYRTKRTCTVPTVRTAYSRLTCTSLRLDSRDSVTSRDSCVRAGRYTHTLHSTTSVIGYFLSRTVESVLSTVAGRAGFLFGFHTPDRPSAQDTPVTARDSTHVHSSHVSPPCVSRASRRCCLAPQCRVRTNCRVPLPSSLVACG